MPRRKKTPPVLLYRCHLFFTERKPSWLFDCLNLNVRLFFIASSIHWIMMMKEFVALLNLPFLLLPLLMSFFPFLAPRKTTLEKKVFLSLYIPERI